MREAAAKTLPTTESSPLAILMSPQVLVRAQWASELADMALTDAWCDWQPRPG